MTTQPDLAGPVAATTELTKFLDPLRVPPVIKVAEEHERHGLEMTAQETFVRLHSELPRTPVWAYEGHFPGPTIEVRRGQRLRVAWQNAVRGAVPLTAVDVDAAEATAGPGRDGAAPRPDVAALPPWLVVHLHGAHTGAVNDGWPENAVLPGEAQPAEYLNDQPATSLWYHDHAMAITSVNVMAGLAGMYVIRDDEEDALQLPRGRQEVPLIICDRNLDTNDDGELTGDLLYKLIISAPDPTAPPTDPAERRVPFGGPFTLVNGVIWPHLQVDARWYRFRMLNASNHRPYTFELHDENGALVEGALHQIGSDGGLLPVPASLDRLTLAPAERADVLIDFSAFRGESLTLVNTRPLPVTPDIPSTLNPDVMQFRVNARPVRDRFRLPATLSPSFVPITHDTLPPEHEHRWLVLTALRGHHAELWEMREIEHAPAGMPVDGIVQIQLPGQSRPTTLQRISRAFEDAANFYVERDGWEQWKFLNLSPIAHPMHIHLVSFQALSRDRYDIASFDDLVGGTSAPVTFVGAGTLEPGEMGWKDTILVDGSQPGQVPPLGDLVSVAARFVEGNGRYVYHCHILEHEDAGMMRTFVVMPKEVMAMMGHMPHHAHD
jgi:FtsP/CotA-like multicopper oxidase with cupredoxin domain